MPKTDYSRGLHDLGKGAWAWLLPSGTYGYSNAGLITDGSASLLVDTLFDKRLTAEMLVAMKDAAGFGAEEIGTLVNTHANGDHTYGNSLVRNATIYASAATAHEMAEEAGPEQMLQGLKYAEALGDVGKWLVEKFGAFDFEGITLRHPDRTFSGETTLTVGDKPVHLIEVGPAHTQGDILVHSPADRTVYTGDILFIGTTPVAWAGPVRNWVKACDRIMALDVETIVPGHGPITDKAGVKRMQDYLVFVDTEARKRHAAGLDSWEAAQDIALGEFGAWQDASRIVVTIDTIYREINNDTAPPQGQLLMSRVVELDRRYAHHGHAHG